MRPGQVDRDIICWDTLQNTFQPSVTQVVPELQKWCLHLIVLSRFSCHEFICNHANFSICNILQQQCHSLIAYSLLKHLLFVLDLPPADFIYCNSFSFFKLFFFSKMSNNLLIYVLHDFTDLSTTFQTKCF